MIQIQETLDADFKRVKEELTDQLNLCIINGKHNLVFNVEQHSVVSNRDVYKTMRKKLCDELRSVPQIRSVPNKRGRNVLKNTKVQTTFEARSQKQSFHGP